MAEHHFSLWQTADDSAVSVWSFQPGIVRPASSEAAQWLHLTVPHELFSGQVWICRQYSGQLNSLLFNAIRAQNDLSGSTSPPRNVLRYRFSSHLDY